MYDIRAQTKLAVGFKMLPVLQKRVKDGHFIGVINIVFVFICLRVIKVLATVCNSTTYCNLVFVKLHLFSTFNWQLFGIYIVMIMFFLHQ